MSRLFLLYSTLLLSCAFLAVPESQPYDFFPFSDSKVTAEWYVFYLCEHLILIVFAFFIFMESDQYKFALGLFLLIQVMDTADFMLTYSDPWFYLNDTPITFNIVKVLIFTCVLAYESIRLVNRNGAKSA